MIVPEDTALGAQPFDELTPEMRPQDPFGKVAKIGRVISPAAPVLSPATAAICRDGGPAYSVTELMEGRA